MVSFGSSCSYPLSQVLTVPLPRTPGPPIIVVPPQNVTVNISQDAFLACQAEAYPGNLTYTWFQGSSNVFHLRYGRNGDGTGAAVPPKPGPECQGQAGCVVGANPSPQGSRDGPKCATHRYPIPSQPPPGSGPCPGGREPPAAANDPGRRWEIHLHPQQRALEAAFCLSLRHSAL